MSRVLRLMFDVVTNAAAGHGFLEAHRNIFEALVEALRGRGIQLTHLVETCFADTDVERVDDAVFDF